MAVDVYLNGVGCFTRALDAEGLLSYNKAESPLLQVEKDPQSEPTHLAQLSIIIAVHLFDFSKPQSLIYLSVRLI